MAQSELVLVTNVHVTTPTTSPSVQLSGARQYWLAEVDAQIPAGTDLTYTIQSSPDRSVWSDLVTVPVYGQSGTTHTGADASHYLTTFMLHGQGLWWRIVVSSVVGDVLVNKISVFNSDIPYIPL